MEIICIFDARKITYNPHVVLRDLRNELTLRQKCRMDQAMDLEQTAANRGSRPAARKRVIFVEVDALEQGLRFTDSR